MKHSVIIMDVDGTLTNREKKITEKTKEALMRAQELGALLILASGRPTTGLMELSRELQMDQHHGLFAAYNGSKVLDCQTMKVLFNQAMTPKEGQAVLEHMKKFKVKPMIDRGDYLYVNDVYDCMVRYKGSEINIIEYEARGGKFNLCEKKDLAEFADFPLNKILTAGDDDYLRAHYLEMMEPFRDTLNCTFTSDVYFEFTAKGIDKAGALNKALPPLGYKRKDMIAFGDGHNDISMIKYAGIGVAMGNAVSELKEAADEITLSNDKDGIAEFLYRKFPELRA